MKLFRVANECKYSSNLDTKHSIKIQRNMAVYIINLALFLNRIINYLQ